MLSLKVQVWLRSNWGLVSVRLPKFVNERFGSPQSNGFCETPSMPSIPVIFCENAYRFCVLERLRLKSRRAILVTFPKVRAYEIGTSKLRISVLPPTVGNGFVRLVIAP